MILILRAEGELPLQTYTDIAWGGFVKFGVGMPQTTTFDNILTGTDKAK